MARIGRLLALCLLTPLSACATQAELREIGPVLSVPVSMSLAEARDCVADHWIGGLYGKSITPYREGYRIRNSAGQIFEFIEVQPTERGTVVSAYSSFGKVGGFSSSAMKHCTGPMR
jgi:hypothetical protein